MRNEKIERFSDKHKNFGSKLTNNRIRWYGHVLRMYKKSQNRF
jgi:hypothetical protein